MQPIATPDKTIDWTIGSSAVAGSQIERAVLEGIGLDHHNFIVRITVVLIGCKGDIAVDARETLELVEISDDLLRLGADIFHRLGDHLWTVVADCDPPQKRVAKVDLGALQTVEEGTGPIRNLAAGGVADRTEIVWIDLRPVFGLFQQCLGL